MRLALIAATLTAAAWLQAPGPRQAASERAGLQARVQAYVDEWRAAVRAATPVGITWGHSGFFPGYQTELIHVPDLGVTLAIQINTSAPRATGPRSLLRGLYDIAAMVRN